MNFKLILGIVLLAVGITLIVMANHSMGEFGERVSKTFSGNYSDETMWNLIIGIALTAAGAGLVIFCRKWKKWW